MTACGGGARQDVDEPEGNFPVEITTAELPNKQRLARNVDLVLGIKNAGQQTIPDLAITIFTDPNANQPFSIAVDDPRAADPSRPVWVLENGWPKLVGESSPAGAQTANVDTFQFHALPPGETVEAVWKLVPVRPGTYTVTYKLAAGLSGKAKAVNSDGSPAGGKFLVKIASKPPVARVGPNGQVIIGKPLPAPRASR